MNLSDAKFIIKATDGNRNVIDAVMERADEKTQIALRDWFREVATEANFNEVLAVQARLSNLNYDFESQSPKEKKRTRKIYEERKDFLKQVFDDKKKKHIDLNGNQHFIRRCHLKDFDSKDEMAWEKHCEEILGFTC